MALALALVACGEDGSGGTNRADARPPADAGATPSDAAPPPPDAGPGADAAAPLTLQAVSGQLTYAERSGDGRGHLYSLQADGRLRLRITADAGRWTYHAVGPDPRYVVAVRRDGDDGPGEVWIIDVRDRDTYPLSPAGCDAGIGGVGWRDANRVMYAMSCDGEPSVAYLADRDDRTRSRDRLLPLTDHEAPVRDVFPAVSTPIFAYVVDTQVCAGGTCVVKPQIWVGDSDIGNACQLTDGDLSFTDVSTFTGAPVRIGDHDPSFNADLTAMVFSRNVGDKPAGPEGHHDLFQIGLSLPALFGRRPTCALPGSLTRLTGDFIDDALATSGGQPVAGDERFPHGAAGELAPEGRLLFTGQTHGPGGTESRIYSVDLAGNRVPLSAAGVFASHASWIITDYRLGGER